MRSPVSVKSEFLLEIWHKSVILQLLHEKVRTNSSENSLTQLILFDSHLA